MNGRTPPDGRRVEPERWADSVTYGRGIALFNAGYYWEAHEAWEALWHAEGRRGAVADLLKALIRLAAVGVKTRQKSASGTMRHASRAAELVQGLIEAGHARLLGLDLVALGQASIRLAEDPPGTELQPGDPAAPVIGVALQPR